MAPAPELVQSGRTFKIVNAKSGTVIDLSGTDGQSIIGFTDHGGANQRWTTNWTGKSWTFLSTSSGLYLGLNGSPADGTRLIASRTPYEWHIWHDEADNSTYRIFAPNTKFVFDLYNKGDKTPGTPITLWARWAGIHQTWRFIPV